MKKLLLALFVVLVPNVINAATVARVDVNGNKRMDAESVRILAGVKLGENITTTRTNQIAKQLQESGYFGRVDVQMSGNVLKINVSESPIVNMVTIEGNDEVSTDDLKKEIRLKERASYDESTIGADVQRMLTIYQRKGFFGTKIDPKKIELSDNRVNVVYEISEGHPTYITDIEFKGNKVFSDRTLRGQILSREHAWWRFLTQFDVFDEDRIQYDGQLLRQFYADNGYADFMVKNINGTFTPDREYYSVTFDVDEGEKYEFGDVKIDNPFPDVPDRELKRALKTKSGSTYNASEIESSVSALRGVVADYGYAFINVEPVPKKNNTDHTIDLVYQIQKTNRIYLNSINILGNVRTFDSVIEQLLPMREGDPFSLQTIEEGRQSLMRTRYFKDVQMVPSRIADANMMNLDIRVEEQPTGELSGGFGWSNINGFMVDLGITESNFMGRGQIVQLRGSIAQYQKQALFSFTEPFLFGRQLSAGFDISYTKYDYSSLGSYGYDRDSLTVSGRLGWKLTDHWSQTVRLSASFDQNYDLQSGGWSDANLYTLGTNFKYYNLNTNFQQNTHTGIVGNLGIAYTGFGGTETYMRYSGDITAMVKFLDDRWQLRTSMDFGYLQPLGDDYISRVYRYFLGGESLRGFDIAGVGSRNWYYRSYALGGLWKVNGSTQLNFPIFIPDEYQVKGFVFTDYGVLGKPPAREDYYPQDKRGDSNYHNLIDSDWRTSAGFGIYWNTPMGPMNFSWGWPLKMNKYDRERRFLLSFETQF